MLPFLVFPEAGRQGACFGSGAFGYVGQDGKRKDGTLNQAEANDRHHRPRADVGESKGGGVSFLIRGGSLPASSPLGDVAPVAARQLAGRDRAIGRPAVLKRTVFRTTVRGAAAVRIRAHPTDTRRTPCEPAGMSRPQHRRRSRS